MRAIRLLAGVAAAAIAVAVLAYIVDNLRSEVYEATASLTVNLPTAPGDPSESDRSGAIDNAITSFAIPDLVERINRELDLDATVSDVSARPRSDGRPGDLVVTATAETQTAARRGVETALATVLQDRRNDRVAQFGASLDEIEATIAETDRALADQTTPAGDRADLEAQRSTLVAERAAVVETLELDPLEQLGDVSNPSDPVRPEPGRTALLAGGVTGLLGMLWVGNRLRNTRRNERPVVPLTSGDDATERIEPPRLSGTEKAATVAATATAAIATNKLSDRLGTSDTSGAEPEAPPSRSSTAGPGGAGTRFGRTSDPVGTRPSPAEARAVGQQDKRHPSPSTPPTEAPAERVIDGHLDVVSFHLSAEEQASVLLLTDLTDAERGHAGAATLTVDLAKRGLTVAHIKLVGSSDATALARANGWLGRTRLNSALLQASGSRSEHFLLELERHRGDAIEDAIERMREAADRVIVSSNAVGGRSAQIELVPFVDGVIVQAENGADADNAGRDFERVGSPHVATLRLAPKRAGFPLWAAAAGLIALLGAGILAGYLALRDDDATPRAADTTVAPTEPTTAPASTAGSATTGTVAPNPGSVPTIPPGTATPITTAPTTPPTPGTGLVLNLPSDLPELQALRRHRGVYDGGVLYLEGEVASEEESAAFEGRAGEVIGADNVVNNYVVNPDAPESTDGRIVIADNIVFASGSSSLANADQELLDLGLVVMNVFPDVIMRVNAYTDNLGTDETNRVLSQQRAESLVAFFVANGIDANRFEIGAQGENDPVATNTTPEGRAQNRRLEIELLNLLA